MNLLVINHQYQLKKLSAHSLSKYDKVLILSSSFDLDSVLLRRKNFERFPLFESFDALNKVVKGWGLEFLIIRSISKYKKITLMGCQDYYSWRIFRYCKNNNIDFSVIPDNLEFFLRPSLKIKSNISFLKLIIIIFLYRLNPFEYKKSYSFFGSRVVFGGILKGDVSQSDAFYRVDKMVCVGADELQTRSGCFVSQPYIKDFGLNHEGWISRLAETLSSSENYFDKNILLRFHARDSDDYKKILLKNFREIADSDSKLFYVGVFSTLLFEKSLRGDEVFSFFSSFEDFFPRYYVDFVEFISVSLKLNLTCSEPWVLKTEDFEKLVCQVFV